MREIKFRGWNKRSNVMVENIQCFAPRDTFNLNDAFDKDMIVLPLQYTGLKDKNGVEIYEGDIVRVGKKALGHNSKDEDYRTLPIAWNTERTGWCFDSDYMRTWAAGIWTDLEVVGNIYENPDLLK